MAGYSAVTPQELPWIADRLKILAQPIPDSVCLEFRTVDQIVTFRSSLVNQRGKKVDNYKEQHSKNFLDMISKIFMKRVYLNLYYHYSYYSNAIMLEPMILPDCGHTFCKTCIRRVRQNPLTSHCPMCKKPIWSHTQVQPNISLKKIVEKVQAKCIECDSTGALESVAKHKCPEALIPCSHSGCQQSIKRKDAKKHEDECLYLVIACEKCQQNITVANKELHLEKTCPEGKIRCPLSCRKRPKRYVYHSLLYIQKKKKTIYATDLIHKCIIGRPD